jgi:chemotaxis protein CheC
MNMTLDQIDALKEVINIGVGRAAGELNELLQTHISLQIPSVTLLSLPELPKEIHNLGPERLTMVQLQFAGSFDGSAALVFPPDSASKLVAVLVDEEPGTPDFDAVRASTLSEVGNIVINGVMGSISNVLKQHLDFSPPIYMEDTIKGLLPPGHPLSTSTVLLAQTCFTVTSLHIEGNIFLLCETSLLDSLLAVIDAVNVRYY